MDPAVIRDAIKAMQEAEAVFESAVEASDNAPPDPGFAQRIRAVAEASLKRADALAQADLIPGFRWTPVPDPHPVIGSHELRPGGNRPGPAHMWQSYDMAVERLAIHVQGNVLSFVADEFREIGWVLNEIADALEQRLPSATSHRTPVCAMRRKGGDMSRVRGPKAGPQFPDSAGLICGPWATAVRPAITGIDHAAGLCGSRLPALHVRGRSGSQLPVEIGVSWSCCRRGGRRWMGRSAHGSSVMSDRRAAGSGNLEGGAVHREAGGRVGTGCRVGLDLDERVVRRHVARLEAAGWLGRMPWVWGEGSVVWLTGTGFEASDSALSAPVKSPPRRRRSRTAYSSRGRRRDGAPRPRLAVRTRAGGRHRPWAVRMRDERGYRKQLPDLAVWRRGAERPVAIVGEEGHRREDRQRLILEGWRDAILGRAVRRRPVRLRQRRRRHEDQAPRQEGPAQPAEVYRCIATHRRGDPRDRPRPRRRRSRPHASASGHAPEVGSDGRQLRLVPAVAPAPASAARRPRRSSQRNRPRLPPSGSGAIGRSSVSPSRGRVGDGVGDEDAYKLGPFLPARLLA